MQDLGVIRKMDKLGRVVVPAHIRKEMKWGQNTLLEFFAEGGCVFLQTNVKSCVFCGEKNNVQFLRNKPICKDCIDRLKK